jgi:tetratricopeptide (TPR) repeat protein
LSAEFTCLVDAGRLDEAVTCADLLLDRLTEETERGTALELSDILVKGGELLSRVKAYPEALRTFEGTQRRLLEVGDEELCAQGVRAEIGVAMTLSRMGRFEDANRATEGIFALGEPALIALKEVAREASKINTQYGREWLAWALLMKAGVLEALDRGHDRREALDEIVDRFRGDESPLVQMIVAAAVEAL